MKNLIMREEVFADDIQEALNNDEFKIYLQPLVSAENERIDGFEDRKSVV